MGYVFEESISTWPGISKIFYKVSGLQDFILQNSHVYEFIQDVFWDPRSLGTRDDGTD